MEVRVALDHDASRIAELFVQLEYAATPTELALRLPRLLRHPDTEVLIAAQDGQVHGVLVLNMLHPLHVPRAWAVISALVGAAESEAVRRGCAHVELSCSVRRTRAHAFYEAMGFEEVRTRLVKNLASAALAAVAGNA